MRQVKLRHVVCLPFFNARKCWDTPYLTSNPAKNIRPCQVFRLKLGEDPLPYATFYPAMEPHVNDVSTARFSDNTCHEHPFLHI